MKRRTRRGSEFPLRRSGKLKKKLHLVHITSTGAAREIIEHGVLEARYCKHFEKNLVYFFIDRPGYQDKHSNEKSDQINRFPFVFLSEFSETLTPFHAYPFDTGAALNGIFNDLADPDIPLDDYQLKSSFDGINAHIEWAFESKESYFEGTLVNKLDEKLHPWQSVEKSYIDIARMASPTHNRADGRASCIEVALANNVQLSNNSFTAILPKQLIEHRGATNTSLVEKLQRKSINWEMYDWAPNNTPSDFFNEITRITKRIVENDL